MCILGQDLHSRSGFAFSVRHIPILGEDVHSRWGTSPFPVRTCIPGEAHPHSRWGWITMKWTSSLGIGMCLIGNAHHNRKWGCASPGMHILTGNGDVPHRECTSSPGMGICLTGNGNVPHQEWGCASPGMRMCLTRNGVCLTGNGNVLHQEWGCASPGVHILTGNAHSLYRMIRGLFGTNTNDTKVNCLFSSCYMYVIPGVPKNCA